MAKKPSGEETALALYDEELAALAAEAAGQEANIGGGGKKFSTRGGVLSFGGNPIPGNKMGVIVVDSVILNTLYPPFNQDEIQSPTCFAIGRDDATVGPHQEAEQPQADKCATCPMNQFGSAERGKGKACQNRRRLALISAGEYDETDAFVAIEDPEHFATAEVGYLEIAPTSLKGYASWHRAITSTKKPPLAYYTEVSLVPEGTYHKAVFQNLGPVPNALLATILARYKQVKDEIGFTYPKGGEAEQQAPKKAPPRRQAAAPTRAPAKPTTQATKPAPAATSARAPAAPARPGRPSSGAPPARQAPPARSAPPPARSSKY